MAFKGQKRASQHGGQSQDFSYLESLNCHNILLDWLAVPKFTSGELYQCFLFFAKINDLGQVNEKQRRPGQSRTLFSIEREDHSGHFFDSLSEFLHPITDVNELMTSSSLPVKNVKVVSNQSNLEICPMIPPNLHGAVKVVSLYFFFQTSKKIVKVCFVLVLKLTLRFDEFFPGFCRKLKRSQV